jgi:hyperosmotically inducible protein
MIAVLAVSSTVAAAALPAGTNTAEIEAKVAKQLKKLPYYGVFDYIEFEVNGGTVTLYGKVYDGINKQNAEAYVSKVEGVLEVVNNIQLLPPSSFDDTIRRRTVRAFENGGSISRHLRGPNPSMRIIVDRGRLTLEGTVSNEGDRNYAGILAKGIPGVFGVTNNLVVEGAK